jgi:hypothetical protein
MVPPLRPSPRHIGSVLLGGVQAFFKADPFALEE